MTSTGRHLDETQAGIPNAPNERADLYGRSHCERHQGQLPKGRTQRPDIWAHRSRMRSAKEKRALDRGVVASKPTAAATSSAVRAIYGVCTLALEGGETAEATPLRGGAG